MRKISKSYDIIVESSAATLNNLVNKGVRARMCVYVYTYIYIHVCVVTVRCWSLSTSSGLETHSICLQTLDWKFKSEKWGALLDLMLKHKKLPQGLYWSASSSAVSIITRNNTIRSIKKQYVTLTDDWYAHIRPDKYHLTFSVMDERLLWPQYAPGLDHSFSYFVG